MNIPLKEYYPDPESLAPLVLEQLKATIEIQFPIEDIPDALTREARDHEAFAESRRRTYIGRPDYCEALDHQIVGNGTPLVLLGDSGSGKSALLSNWVDRWRKANPNDFIFQHYIGGTSDSSIHWKLMTRLMAEIKRWTNDETEIPRTHDDILRDFTVWLAKARIKAEHIGVKFIVILDALNQLEDKDHAHTLGWLPVEPFKGNLRLIVSTLPGTTLEAIEKRELPILRIEQLTPQERKRIMVDYLKRFGKSLDKSWIERISEANATSNPLFLKILLDELRVTLIHDNLNERLNDYLSATDIPTLLQKVLVRYQRDYEHDRKGLVRDALGLIWSARRGLTETELLQLLRPDNLPQLQLAIWSPLRAVLEESLISRGGILNFAHDFLRSAVEAAIVPNLDKKDDYRIQLADYFEYQTPTARSCDELPWLLWQTEQFERLRVCLLNIDCFLEILERDEDELRIYWVRLGEEKSMGQAYLNSFNKWSEANADVRIYLCANKLGNFLHHAALYMEAEPLYHLSLKICEANIGKDHPAIAITLNNLSQLLQATNRQIEAEPLMRRVLKIIEVSFGEDHPYLASDLNNLGGLLDVLNRLPEAEQLYRRALKIDEVCFGKDHPNVARDLNNLAQLLTDTNRMREAEPLLVRALKINVASFGENHPRVATSLNNLALLLVHTNRSSEAESLYRKALHIDENNFGKDHPDVARVLNNLAQLLTDTNRKREAEPLMVRALKIHVDRFGEDNLKVATSLNNLAGLLISSNLLSEAETLLKRALRINIDSLGMNHPKVATALNNLAQLFSDSNRLVEAESLYRHAVEILINYFHTTGYQHPNLKGTVNNYVGLLQEMGWSSEQIMSRMREMGANL